MGNQLIEICANVKTKRCPEYDTFEGNSETMSVAIHTCDYTPPNEYPSCDRVSMLTRAKERKFFLYLLIFSLKPYIAGWLWYKCMRRNRGLVNPI